MIKKRTNYLMFKKHSGWKKKCPHATQTIVVTNVTVVTTTYIEIKICIERLNEGYIMFLVTKR